MTTATDQFPLTQRTRLRRQPARGSYDRALAYSILDEALHCHVAFAGEDGQPMVLPTIHARIGDRLFFHGSRASRLLAALAGPSCVTVTLLDGLVLARSAFHHSMNYRSVMVLGCAREVEDERDKRAALAAIVEHVMRGRSAVARGPSATELKATRVMALALDEASVKLRTGPPRDDDADLDVPCWAGVVPLSLAAGEPQPAPDLRGAPPPPSPAELARPAPGVPDSVR